MQNIFKYRADKARARSEPRRRNGPSPDRDIKLHDEMAKVSRKRAKNWAKQKLHDSDTQKVLNEGLVQIIDTKSLSFRTPQKDDSFAKEEMNCGNYIPEKERAEKAHQEFQRDHLEITPYKTRINFLTSIRRREKEIGPDMRFACKTEKERRESFLKGPVKLLDMTAKDNSMLVSPRWRSVDKNKWMDRTRGFDLTTCYFRGLKSEAPWPVVKTGLTHGEKYIGGFDIIGDGTRKRIKHLEISTNDFLTAIGSNPNSKGFVPSGDSISIRTQQYLNYLTRDESKNKKLYPKTMKHVVTNISIEKEIVESEDNPPTNTSRSRLAHLTTSMPSSPIKNLQIPDYVLLKNRKKTSQESISGNSMPPLTLLPVKKKVPTLLPVLKREISIEQKVNDYFY